MWTPEQLISRGATNREVARHRRRSTKVRHGVYTDPVDDEWELYRPRCIAVARSISGAVLTGPSAAVL